MKGFPGTALGSRISLWVLSLVLILTVAAPSGAGAGTKSKPAEVPARVIAHLPLATPPGNEMVLQKNNNKQYLYIQAASKQSYTIVEVTKPEFPTLVSPTARAKDAAAGRLDIVGSDLGIAEVPEASANTIRGSSTTETVRILDLTDPAHPKVLQTFAGVTSILPDGGRGLIYLTNNEGLWILKHSRPTPAAAKKQRPCTSEDTLAAMPPDCQ